MLVPYRACCGSHASTTHLVLTSTMLLSFFPLAPSSPCMYSLASALDARCACLAHLVWCPALSLCFVSCFSSCTSRSPSASTVGGRLTSPPVPSRCAFDASLRLATGRVHFPSPPLPVPYPFDCPFLLLFCCGWLVSDIFWWFISFRCAYTTETYGSPHTRSPSVPAYRWERGAGPGGRRVRARDSGSCGQLFAARGRKRRRIWLGG